jgi:Flp pilus assembly protein TadD
VSLLQDAMKAKQRERAERTRPESDPQLAVQGFFPYASKAPTRTPAKRRAMFLVGGAAALLLVVAVWLGWQKGGKASSSATRPPIILPPPVTVSNKPPVVDSFRVAASDAKPAAPDAKAAVIEPKPAVHEASSSGQSAVSLPKQRRPPLRDEPISPRPIASEPADNPTAMVNEPARVRPVTVDYEAQATILFAAGDLAGARDKFEHATKAAPSARVWTNYGVTLQRLGDLDGAVAAYRSAIGIDPNYLEAWLYQARVAAEQGELARAIPLLQRALAINPLNADANVELARLEYESHNWTEARRFAETALRGDATSSRAYWYLAVASDPLKDSDAAIRGYTGYLKYVADTPEQVNFIGWARTRLAELGRKP